MGGGALLNPKSRTKGTLIIKGATGEASILGIQEGHKREHFTGGISLPYDWESLSGV